MLDDRRALLEAIAYGDDPKVTPNDRLRALEMLNALTIPEDDEALAIGREVAGMTDEELDQALAEYAPAMPGSLVAEVFDIAKQVQEEAARLGRVADARAIPEDGQQVERVAKRRPADAAPPAVATEESTADPARDRPTDSRKGLNPDETGYSQHIPEGMSAQAWEASWPLGRYRR